MYDYDNIFSLRSSMLGFFNYHLLTLMQTDFFAFIDHKRRREEELLESGSHWLVKIIFTDWDYALCYITSALNHRKLLQLLDVPITGEGVVANLTSFSLLANDIINLSIFFLQSYRNTIMIFSFEIRTNGNAKCIFY